MLESRNHIYKVYKTNQIAAILLTNVLSLLIKQKLCTGFERIWASKPIFFQYLSFKLFLKNSETQANKKITNHMAL